MSRTRPGVPDNRQLRPTVLSSPSKIRHLDRRSAAGGFSDEMRDKRVMRAEGEKANTLPTKMTLGDR